MYPSLWFHARTQQLAMLRMRTKPWTREGLAGKDDRFVSHTTSALISTAMLTLAMLPRQKRGHVFAINSLTSSGTTRNQNCSSDDMVCFKNTVNQPETWLAPSTAPQSERTARFVCRALSNLTCYRKQAVSKCGACAATDRQSGPGTSTCTIKSNEASCASRASRCHNCPPLRLEQS